MPLLTAECTSSSVLTLVAASRDIAYGNGWLVACSLVHMGLAVVLVRSQGAVGLIAADAANMVLRIAFCLVFVARHFRGIRSFQLRELFPSGAAVSALAAASMVCLASDSVLFKGTALPESLQVCHCCNAWWKSLCLSNADSFALAWHSLPSSHC